jgi:hypothetical protein
MSVKSDRPRDQLDPGPRKIVRVQTQSPKAQRPWRAERRPRPRQLPNQRINAPEQMLLSVTILVSSALLERGLEVLRLPRRSKKQRYTMRSGRRNLKCAACPPLAKTDAGGSSPSIRQPAETCSGHRIVSRHKAELSVKYSKVSANFFGCFLIAFVDKKIGAIVFPIPSLCHPVNVSDWSDPIGERAIMLSNYVSRIARAAPNVGPIIGCFLCPSDRHPGFVYVEKLCSNRRDQDFAPS